MMRISTAVALTAALALCACEEAAPEAAAPAPKKSLARQAQLYAGQEQVTSIDAGTIEKDVATGALKLTAAAKVPMAGYTDAGFLPRIYAAPPPDGVYELDVVATRPATPGAQAITPLEVKGAWAGYNKDRLKGVKLISKSNEIVAMLPPG